MRPIHLLVSILIHAVLVGAAFLVLRILFAPTQPNDIVIPIDVEMVASDDSTPQPATSKPDTSSLEPIPPASPATEQPPCEPPTTTPAPVAPLIPAPVEQETAALPPPEPKPEPEPPQDEHVQTPHHGTNADSPSPNQPEPESLAPSSQPSANAVTTAPEPLLSVRPHYPRQARRRGIEGKVVISLRIAADGSVIEVHILSSSGHRELDDAALNAAKRTQFRPGTRNGQTEEAETTLAFDFRLTER